MFARVHPTLVRDFDPPGIPGKLVNLLFFTDMEEYWKDHKMGWYSRGMAI